ncbi:LADA_0B00606g1_1 [Lachancea dasiensis]|uniref:LADA_0B00606g1_1 n=1 Tax=Lachancea dasiensis TaxID=1072105 RepID=A0A1G4IRP4_9SACH|nr:LADA_0B00606g1_1 [Lachancea dasiensis]
MSRAREIQEKLSLQASLQAAFNDNKVKALDWLGDRASRDCSEDLTSSKTAFYQLPVISMGAGLSFNDSEIADNSHGNKDDISTIGEFINSDKKISSLAKKKKQKATAGSSLPREARISNGIHKTRSDDTRAMVALKRKIRNTNRTELRTSLETSKTRSPLPAPTNNQDGSSEDSDDDNGPRVEKTVKKTFGLLFQGKKKNKR